MAYSATWVQPTYDAAWPAPPAGLATLHLLGDPQNDWTAINDRAPNRVVDQVTRDMDRGMLTRFPDAALQMGDIIAGSNDLLADHKADLDLARKWLDSLGYPTVWPVVGNHDTPGDLIDGRGWMHMWGLTEPNYSIDLGGVRVIVLGWVDNGYSSLSARHTSPVGPYPHSLVDWLDAELASDTRPTLIANHAHLRDMPTGLAPDGSNYTWWEWNQSTIDPLGNIDVEANYLRDCLHDHTHVIGWLYAHSHSFWDGKDRNPSMGAGDPSALNVGLFDLSTTAAARRSLAIVDAAALFEHTNTDHKNPAASPFVTILDDGRTLETRWRQHDWGLWASVPGQGRVQRVVVP